MFDLAIKACLPLVGVKTDDPVNLETVLSTVAGQPVVEVEKLTTSVIYQKGLFYTSDEKLATVETYEMMRDKGKTMVFVNIKPNPLVFDAGWLTVPEPLMQKMLSQYSNLPAGLSHVLSGLSLKTAEELLMLASAKYGKIDQKTVRIMRQSMGQSILGLYPMETDWLYYEPLPELMQWLQINSPYFLNPSSPDHLVPRGLLFDGPPGTGKTMAAKAVAKHLDVPLYRMDVATTLNRYIGESESRLAQQLALLDREAPCVTLLDEVEKVFVGDSDTGVIDRMLSQLLWWLSEHRGRVLMIMTTNNMAKIPPELYRPGRVDQVFQVKLMDTKQANDFAKRLLTELLKPNKPGLKQLHALQLVAQPGHPGWSAADVTALVKNVVKKNQWVPLDKPEALGYPTAIPNKGV